MLRLPASSRPPLMPPPPLLLPLPLLLLLLLLLPPFLAPRPAAVPPPAAPPGETPASVPSPAAVCGAGWLKASCRGPYTASEYGMTHSGTTAGAKTSFSGLSRMRRARAWWGRAGKGGRAWGWAHVHVYGAHGATCDRVKRPATASVQPPS